MAPVASSFVPLAVDLFLFSQLISGPCTNTLVFQLGMDQHQVRGSTCGHRPPDLSSWLYGLESQNSDVPHQFVSTYFSVSSWSRAREVLPTRM